MLSSIQNASQALNQATEQIHIASQYLAMAGKFVLPPADDDSHTNLEWRSDLACFVSRDLGTANHLKLVLYPQAFRLFLVNGEFEALAQVDLDGKNLEDITKWVKESLALSGIKSPNYNLDFHYQLPEYQLLKERIFDRRSDESHEAFATIRSMSDQILSQYQPYFEHASELRTWPHHFDHGVYCPVAFAESGEASKSISLGLAIHDQTIPEHYFYITHWQAKGSTSEENLQDLPGKAYWNTAGFTGAILKISDLLEMKNELERKEQLHHYFLEGIQQSLQLVGAQRLSFQ